MNADEIRRALFPHEETIKRLQEENAELRAKLAEFESKLLAKVPVAKDEMPDEMPEFKEKKRGVNTRKES